MSGDLDAIRDFIRQETGHQGDIDVDADLLEAKVLDSFNIVTVAVFIQEHFGVELEPEDLSRDNLARISRMLELVEQKRRAAAGDGL